jgi:hypothetical protein
MKITGFRTLVTEQHWGRPVGDVNGFIRDGITEVPVVIIETDGGLDGIGVGSHADIDRVFPALEGQDPRATFALYDRMLAHVFKSGHSGATFGGIGTLDMALWDLKAKMAGEPLWRTLGARDRYVPGYASALEIAVGDDALEALYAGWLDRGFTSVKVKGGLDFDRDVARLTTIRDIFRTNSARPAIMFDANESWSRKQAIRYIEQFKPYLTRAPSTSCRQAVSGESLTSFGWRPSRTAVTCRSAPSDTTRTRSPMPRHRSPTTSRSRSKASGPRLGSRSIRRLPTAEWSWAMNRATACQLMRRRSQVPGRAWHCRIPPAHTCALIVRVFGWSLRSLLQTASECRDTPRPGQAARLTNFIAVDTGTR